MCSASSNYNTIFTYCYIFIALTTATLRAGYRLCCQLHAGLRPKDILQSTRSFQKPAKLNSAGEEAAVLNLEQLIEHPVCDVALIQCDACSV